MRVGIGGTAGQSTIEVPVPGGIVIAAEPNGSLIVTRRCRNVATTLSGSYGNLFRPVHDFRTQSRELVLGRKNSTGAPERNTLT